MATRLQKKLAKAIVEDVDSPRPKEKKELLVSVGYRESTAESNAKIILEAKGTKEELTNLGFSEEGAKQVVSEILYDKAVVASSRLMAADQVFKAHGTYAPTKNLSVNVEVDAPQIIKELNEKLNALYRGTDKSGDGVESGIVGVEASNKE
jgi:hypothetical protein